MERPDRQLCKTKWKIFKTCVRDAIKMLKGGCWNKIVLQFNIHKNLKARKSSQPKKHFEDKGEYIDLGLSREFMAVTLA